MSSGVRGTQNPILWISGGRVPGGWGGIRTHERLAPLPVFRTGALNRSATHPACKTKYLVRGRSGQKAELPPDCHRDHSKRTVLMFLIRFRSHKSCIDDLSCAIVRVCEEVPIYAECNRW
jgi:hypothetical protein